MKPYEAKVGNWVRFLTTDTKDSFVGFIVSTNNNYARVAIPSNRRTVSLPYENLKDYEKPSFTLEELDGMIDIALDVRDFEWVKELRELKAFMEGWAG